MKTGVENKELNYQAQKRYGSMNRSIDTSYNLPDSFRTVENTKVEVLDLVLDENGNLIDSPVINNSSNKGVIDNKLNTEITKNNQTPNSYNSYNVGGKTATEVLNKSGTSSASSAAQNEVLDLPVTNSSKSKDGKDLGNIIDNRNQPFAQNNKKGAEDEMAIKTEKLGAVPGASSANTSAHPQINVNDIEFEGELMPTGNDDTSGNSNDSSSGGEDTVSSSHRQTESLAYYSNDWISIFDTLADTGYNSVLDTNYFNNAYASTAAKLAKNAKYVR